MTVDRKKAFLIDAAFIVLVGAIAYFVLKFCLIYLLPFVIGLLLAVSVQKPAEYLSKLTKIKSGVFAVILVVVLFLIVIFLLGLLLYFAYDQVGKLIPIIKGFFSSWNEAFAEIGERFSHVFNALPAEIINALRSFPGSLVQKATDILGSLVTYSASTVVKSGPGMIVSIIVTVVASCYIAKDYVRVTETVKSFINKRTANVLSNIKSIFFDSIFKLGKSYLLLMIITFAELSIGLFLLGVKNPVMLAAVIAIVDILPVLGTGAVVIPWAVISLITGDIWRCIGLIIMYLVITIVRNFLEPKVIGDQVGLHPLLTLIAMFVGLRLFGFLGLFIFPIALIIIFELNRREVINIFPWKNSQEKE